MHYPAAYGILVVASGVVACAANRDSGAPPLPAPTVSAVEPMPTPVQDASAFQDAYNEPTPSLSSKAIDVRPYDLDVSPAPRGDASVRDASRDTEGERIRAILEGMQRESSSLGGLRSGSPSVGSLPASAPTVGSRSGTTGRAGSLRAADGGLTSEEIRRQVSAHLGAIGACYELSRDAGIAPEGTVELTWTIDPNGDVRDATVSSSTLGAPKLDACVLRQIKGWRFRPTGTPTTVRSFPFRFGTSKK